MSNAIISYEDFTGISKEEAKTKVSFPFVAENAISEDTGISLKRKAIYRLGEEDNKSLLGLVPENRVLVSYGDVTEWVCGEIDKIGVDYKIISSQISGKSSNMTQKYVLNYDITNPDGFKLSPMLIVESSYVGVPVALEMGVFRFVCSNGVYVGSNIFERTKISARKLENFGRVSTGDVIRRGLDKIVALGDTYQTLAEEDWRPYFIEFLNSPRVDVEFKKHAVEYLLLSDDIYALTAKTLKNEDFLGAVNTDGTIYNRSSEAILCFGSKGHTNSAWEFYNNLTYISTHESSTLSIQKRTGHMISEIFAA